MTSGFPVPCAASVQLIQDLSAGNAEEDLPAANAWTLWKRTGSHRADVLFADLRDQSKEQS